ncbi:MAG: amidohydrolase family protein [Candidatus Methanomethyliaceae archaeon]
MLDYRILGCRIVDGSGNPWFRADIGIKDGKIATIGDLSDTEAIVTITSQNIQHDERNAAPAFVISPGFIDIHSHADYTILAGTLADSFIRQGVTTVVMGNCGFSLAPVSSKNLHYIAKHLRHAESIDITDIEWRDFSDLFRILENQGCLYNVISFCGHNTLRTAVMGLEPRQPTKEELFQMEELLEQSFDEGVVGLSAGLEFPPGRAATLHELLSLCQICARKGGLYSPHIRNRDQYYAQSVKEALEISKKTGVKLQIAHLNCRANSGASYNAWEQVVSMVEEARELDGLDVGTDCIPYSWGPGSFIGILPDWFVNELSSDLLRALQLLKDPAVRNKLWVDSDRYWRFVHRGEWNRVRLSVSKSHAELVGLDFIEIGERLHKEPWEAFLQLLSDEKEGVWGLQLYGQLFTEEHVTKLVKHPLFCLSSDSGPSSDDGFLARAFVNQAAFGWVARVLGYYVREHGILRLEEAIRKMTSYPAQRLGLQDRGMIREGFWADLVIFEPTDVQDITTVENPIGYCKGIYYVFVNGVLVIENNKLTGQKPGRIITLR